MTKVQQLLKNWPLHLAMLAIVVVFEAVNTITIKTPIGNISLLPMLFAMVAGLVLYLIKPLKFIKEEQSHLSGDFVLIGIGFLLAKVAVNTGISLQDVLRAGPALILQELGNLGTIILALPLALLLGFRREAIGMTHSISREPNVAYIATKYGSESAEFRGVMVTYIVGTLLGTIFMGLMASVLGGIGILHPFSLAMACGVGSGSMMAASSASVAAAFPDLAEQISAYAGTSNVLSNADGVIMSVILGVPMCNALYKWLDPLIGQGRKEKKAKKA